MKRIVFTLHIILAFFSAFSQRGKDGSVTISATSTVNAYAALSLNASAGSTTLSVSSGAAFSAGDLIYIVQMQGASVNCYINIWGNPNSPEPYDPSFGNITAYNNAGNNEYAQVSSVSGTIITIDCALKNNYTAAGKVQVIRVPRYSSLNVTGTITCPPWNGTTGGVIAIEVEGNTVIGSSGRIDASGKGFRGGITVGKTTGLMGGGSWGHNNSSEGGYKGESIAGDVAAYLANFNGPYCKGAVANGGGGGNANNSGGGGGANGGNINAYTGTGNPDASTANYVTAWNLESAGFATSSSSGGGRGGYAFSDANISPLTNGPNLATWNGDARRNQGGIGGRPLDYSTGKIFAGGGGGAGDENDTYGGAGGNGGGIINIITYGSVSGGGQILSDGQNGFNTNAPSVNFVLTGRDGAGGGGGGGAIFINAVGGMNTLTVSAKGGNGGNQQMRNGGASTNNSYGPGGGGGGGHISTTPATITTAINGGTNGIVVFLNGLNGSQIDNLFPPNGATRGGSGTVTSTLNPAVTITTTSQGTICANNSATVAAGSTGTATIQWYTQNSGGSVLGSGSIFTTSVLTTPGTYTLYAGYCPDGTYRVPAIITVTNSPTVSATSATVCSGQTATLTASGAGTYTWSTGANTSSITVNPASTTIYTVTGSNGGCTANATTTVSVGAGGTLTVNNATICSGQNATLTASGASTYTWSTGSNSASITVSPSANSVYTILATNGVCQLTNTANVSVTANPTVSVNNATICAGQSATLSASGATSYSWNTGATSSSITPNPGSSTTYTVTGYNGLCSSANTASVSVTPAGSLTVNSATVCAGQNATLTAGAASSYTWSNGSNTSSLVVSPSSTSSYTVNAIIASCPVSNTATVTVNSNPTVTVNSATICSGQSATLTAGGATSYLWNTSASTATLGVSPASTQVYTVTGTSNNCNDVRTATVTVNSNPTVAVNSATICSGSQATLIATGASSYTWNTGANSSSIQPQPLATTIYTVTGTTGNCSDQRTATITVNSNPTVSVNSATICSGSQTTLTASGAGTYSWSTGSTSSSIALQPSATTVYTVTGSNGNCADQKTATITVNTTPTVSVNSSTTCAGNSATLTASGATSYSWSNGAASGSISVSPAATQVYSVTGFNSNCTGIASATVQVFTTPTLNVNSNSFNLCSGESATISAVSSENTYTWSTGDNTSQIITGSAGNYTVSSSNNCGITSSVVTVSVSSGPPSFTIVPSSSVICSGQSVTLTAMGSSGSYTWNTTAVSNSIIVATPTVYVATLANSCGTVSSQIDIGGNTPPPINITASSSTLCSGGSVTLTANSPGNLLWAHNSQTTAAVTVSVTGIYTVTSSNECGSTVENYTIVNGPPPAITIIQSGALCSGQSATLTANGADSYSWNTGDNTPQIIISTDGTFTATGTNSCGTSNAVYSVSFQPLPQVSLTASDYTICSSETTTLTANGVNGTGYIWESFPSNSTNTQTVSSSGIYTVIIVNGCGTDTAMISISESTVQADFNLTPSSGLAPLNVSFTNTSGNNSANQWDFGNGQTSGNAGGQTTTYTTPGIYTVTLVVQNDDGCSSVRTRTLEVIPTEFGPIPEVITPNNDNYNDVFYINGIERYPNNELQIFNRWGNLVYQMKNYNNSWKGNSNVNGKTEGDKLPAGTYFILLQLNDSSGKVYKTYCQLMY